MDTIIVKIKKSNKNTYWYKYMIDCHFEVRNHLDADNQYICIRCLDVNKLTAVPNNHYSMVLATINRYQEMNDKIKTNSFQGCFIDKNDVYTIQELRKQKINKIYDR